MASHRRLERLGIASVLVKGGLLQFVRKDGLDGEWVANKFALSLKHGFVHLDEQSRGRVEDGEVVAPMDWRVVGVQTLDAMNRPGHGLRYPFCVEYEYDQNTAPPGYALDRLQPKKAVRSVVILATFSEEAREKWLQKLKCYQVRRVHAPSAGLVIHGGCGVFGLFRPGREGWRGKIMRAMGGGQAKAVGILGLRMCDVHVCACARIHPSRDGGEREREIPTNTL